MIEVSPTTLNLFLECLKCFWLTVNEKIKRPAGIFRSLSGGMDYLVKRCIDSYRKMEFLPPEIDGKVLGTRNWIKYLHRQRPNIYVHLLARGLSYIP